MKMVGCQERRLTERYGIHLDKLIRPFNADVLHRARETNHSGKGICFALPVALKPGTVIQIIRTECSEKCQGGPECSSCKQNILATVIWCLENNGEGMRSYSIGAKYFEYGIGY